MSIMGLGSVSDYCLHNMHTPVLVVRSDAKHMDAPVAGGEHAAHVLQPLHVCLAADESPQSLSALHWAAKHLLAGREMVRLHILTVAPSVPYPVGGCAGADASGC